MAGKLGRSGRTPFAPTNEDRKLVAQMVAVGIPQEQIALVVRDGIHLSTLKKYFKPELTTSRIKAHAKMGASIYNSGINGNFQAAKWYSQAQMGWRETDRHEIVGADGGALKLDITRRIIDPAKD
jgi:hypothetical protein